MASMETPNEAPMMRKCHSCEVPKPLSEFLTFAFGKRAGRVASECTQCWSKMKYPPRLCGACFVLRPWSEFDRTAENGNVCKVCLTAEPSKYRKQCSWCRDIRPFTEFPKESRTHYVQPTCGTCDSRLSLKRRKGTSTEVKAFRRALHRDKVKALAYAAYGGERCACCGETEMKFLTLDHINNDGAEWRRKTFGSNKLSGGTGVRVYEWCKRNGYPPIFQVLCWNCQNGKRFNGGICPHQTGTRNDHPHAGVGSSEPKRIGSQADRNMVSSASKDAAVRPYARRDFFAEWIQ